VAFLELKDDEMLLYRVLPGKDEDMLEIETGTFTVDSAPQFNFLALTWPNTSDLMRVRINRDQGSSSITLLQCIKHIRSSMVASRWISCEAGLKTRNHPLIKRGGLPSMAMASQSESTIMIPLSDQVEQALPLIKELVAIWYEPMPTARSPWPSESLYASGAVSAVTVVKAWARLSELPAASWEHFDILTKDEYFRGY
jgi:hypothetical protein